MGCPQTQRGTPPSSAATVETIDQRQSRLGQSQRIPDVVGMKNLDYSFDGGSDQERKSGREQINVYYNIVIYATKKENHTLNLLYGNHGKPCIRASVELRPSVSHCYNSLWRNPPCSYRVFIPAIVLGI